MKITSKQLRNKWLNFYKERGHVDIGGVSLIGDGTTGVMFNVAGMQPLMPYLLGQPHQKGKRLCNVQGCVRTVDIEEVGDESHCTFFEMLGNWSLGDYFKKEKTAWSFEFLTKELGFDREKLCTTVFGGNDTLGKDDEIVEYLLEAGVKKENIFFLKDNWWDLPGTINTPCGPDNEWFYPRHDNPCSENCDATCECGRWVEIGNDVYMQYKKLANGEVEPLKNKNVDTGFGFERLLMYVNNLSDVFMTDVFSGVINCMENALQKKYGEDKKTDRAMRIIADHMRTAVMLMGDENGILPSNVGAGYILRRLIRRGVRYANELGLKIETLLDIAKIYIEEVYNEAYPLLLQKEEYIISELQREVLKFNKALDDGRKEFEKTIKGIEKHKEFAMQRGEVVENVISGKAVFRLFDTFGFPFEITKELARERGYDVDEEGFKKAFEEHQAKSKVAQGVFKGGLADTGEMTTRLHTACHLTLAGLRKMFGNQIEQKGSNITPERLRLDFNFDRKLTDEEVKQLEDFVNDAIKREIDVERVELNFAQALKQGAYGVHKAQEDELVSVYKIGDVDFQICGGPHVKNTRELVKFKVAKQESVSAGMRRIKGILE